MSLFIKDEYWHDNEPGCQIPFMYNYTASPYKIQRQVLKILAEEYSDGAGGLSGNGNAGQMSAWYVFAAMGFYPVDPVSNEYELCVPLFDSVTIYLMSSKTFSIIGNKKSAGADIIGRMMLGGTPYKRHAIRYSDIMQGGKIVIYTR